MDVVDTNGMITPLLLQAHVTVVVTGVTVLVIIPQHAIKLDVERLVYQERLKLNPAP